MKKSLVALFLALTMLLSATGALAAGKLNVTQENFHVLERYSETYGYAYARVENIGNRPIKVNACILEIFDENGDVLTSTDSFSSYARYLQPGEYTYVSSSDACEDAEISEVDDYMLTITGKNENEYVSKRLDVVTNYEEDVKNGYYTYDYMYADITNNTEEVIYNITVVMALLDSEDNILYVSSSDLGSSEGLMPGSTVRIRLSVADNFVSYIEKNEFVPVKVDAIAYTNVEID